MVPTVVKNARPITSKYVVGANDEPNGHGTIQVECPSFIKPSMAKRTYLKEKLLVGILKM